MLSRINELSDAAAERSRPSRSPYPRALRGPSRTRNRMRPHLVRPARRLAVSLLVLPWVVGCRSASGPSTATGARVLFIGNSLTSVNDLPRMFASVAEAGGFDVATGEVVFNDVSLSDHLLAGDAAAEIRRGNWDYVVLQQGPSGRPESRVELIASTQQFATIITAEGAQPALYMVWPDVTRPTAFDSVSRSYTDAANAVEGLLFPAGDAWIDAWERKPSLALYGHDGFHPSALGSYLAALTIYAVLCDRSPALLPVQPTGINAVLLRGESTADIRILQDAAGAVTAGLPRKGRCVRAEPTTRALAR